MSRDAKIDIVFAGDVRTFKLAWSNLIALEDACDCPIEMLLRRLHPEGAAGARDIREPIRIGLIGAGVEPRIAERMVDENVGPGRLAEHKMIAFSIVAAAWVGDPREQVGKKKQRAARQKGSQPPSSTDSQQPSSNPSSNLSG